MQMFSFRILYGTLLCLNVITNEGLITKTTHVKFDKFFRRAKNVHSFMTYHMRCVIFFPLVDTIAMKPLAAQSSISTKKQRWKKCYSNLTRAIFVGIPLTWVVLVRKKRCKQ